MQSKGVVQFNLNEVPFWYDCTEWGEFNKEKLVFGLMNLHMGEASRGNGDFLRKECGSVFCMT